RLVDQDTFSHIPPCLLSLHFHQLDGVFIRYLRRTARLSCFLKRLGKYPRCFRVAQETRCEPTHRCFHARSKYWFETTFKQTRPHQACHRSRTGLMTMPSRTFVAPGIILGPSASLINSSNSYEMSIAGVLKVLKHGTQGIVQAGGPSRFGWKE